MKYLFIFFVFLCTSCANNKDNIVVRQDDIRRAPDLAMQKCEDLKELKTGSFEEVALKLQEISNLYHICESKRQSLQDFINKK